MQQEHSFFTLTCVKNVVLSWSYRIDLLGGKELQSVAQFGPGVAAKRSGIR